MMDNQLEHIVKWVESRGIKIVFTNARSSSFKQAQPNTIFITKNTTHGFSEAILHEYYHSQQFRRYRAVIPKLNRQVEFRGNLEYRAETFVIRCFKKLGMVYDKTFIENDWHERFTGSTDMPDYYELAYRLLIKNKVMV